MSFTRCRWIRRSSPVHTVRPKGLDDEADEVETFPSKTSSQTPRRYPTASRDAHDWRPAKSSHLLPFLAVGAHFSTEPLHHVGVRAEVGLEVGAVHRTGQGGRQGSARKEATSGPRRGVRIVLSSVGVRAVGVPEQGLRLWASKDLPLVRKEGPQHQVARPERKLGRVVAHVEVAVGVEVKPGRGLDVADHVLSNAVRGEVDVQVEEQGVLGGVHAVVKVERLGVVLTDDGRGPSGLRQVPAQEIEGDDAVHVRGQDDVDVVVAHAGFDTGFDGLFPVHDGLMTLGYNCCARVRRPLGGFER